MADGSSHFADLTVASFAHSDFNPTRWNSLPDPDARDAGMEIGFIIEQQGVKRFCLFPPNTYTIA